MVKEIDMWLKDGQRDYAIGVDLLARYGGTAQQVRVYRERSARFAMAELMGDLRRLSLRGGGGNEVAVVVPKESVAASRAKKELHELWVKLSHLHRLLYETGEENTAENMAARVAIMEQREPLIERFDLLYEAKEAYFAKKMSEEDLSAVVDGRTPSSEAKQEVASVSDLSGLSDLEVVKRLKAAKQGKVRATNWLQYQQPTAGKVENAMPPCPRRTMWEEKLAVFTAEYDNLLAEKERRGL